MQLRKLELKDSVLMHEWMHDNNTVGELYGNFEEKTIEDCVEFIKNSWEDEENYHLAIVNEKDEYIGTVSLKHIKNKIAEFAIVVRSKAMNQGYGWYGMKNMLDIAFNKFGLDNIYWCVSRDNKRAIRFYEKHFFHEVLDVPPEIKNRYSKFNNLKWYSVLKGDNIDVKDSILGCKVIHINTISTINVGELSFFENNKDIDFCIKRLYYISKVPEGVKRGFHAHKKLKQLIFCPYGKIMITLENELGREQIELSDPSIGLLIEKPTWREMLWMQKNSVLVVAASDYYDEDDYIRDYFCFKDLYCKNK